MSNHISNNRIINTIKTIRREGLESLDLTNKETFDALQYLIELGEDINELIWKHEAQELENESL